MVATREERGVQSTPPMRKTACKCLVSRLVQILNRFSALKMRVA